VSLDTVAASRLLRGAGFHFEQRAVGVDAAARFWQGAAWEGDPRMRSPLAATLILLSPLAAAAQTAPPANNAPPPRWERKAELSLVSTGGNTDTQTLGTGASIIFRPGPWTTEARTAFVRSEAADVETAKSLVADAREARAVTPRMEIFGRYGYLSDKFAGIDHRSTVDGGVGYKLLPGPVHTLRADAGLGYSREARVVGDDLSFALANFGSAYKWQISKTADLSDSALLTASLDDGDAWRFGNAFALTAVMTRVLSLKLSHDVKFNNSPVVGFEKTDRLTSVALVAKF
jgi:putative salt-induced outer membrane protein